MKITYKSRDRKELAKAVGNELNIKAEYLAAPSFAYQVGPYTIDKDGVLTGPDNRGLIADLCGLYSLEAVSKEYDQPQVTNVEAPDFEELNLSEREELGLGQERHEDWQGENGMQASDATIEELSKRNLPALYTIDTPRGEIFIKEQFATRDEAAAAGYSEYFSTALGTVYSYNDDHTFALVTSLKARAWDKTTIKHDFRRAAVNGDGDETSSESANHAIEMPLDGFAPEKLDNLAKLINAKAPLLKAALGVSELPIQHTGNTLRFPWFGGELDADHATAYATLISMLCATAIKKTRVTAKERDNYASPKYSMRCLLLTLGMIGDEYKSTRKILLSRLDGNSSYAKLPVKEAV